MAGGAGALFGEVGGPGSQNFTSWSVRGRVSVPFRSADGPMARSTADEAKPVIRRGI